MSFPILVEFLHLHARGLATAQAPQALKRCADLANVCVWRVGGGVLRFLFCAQPLALAVGKSSRHHMKASQSEESDDEHPCVASIATFDGLCGQQARFCTAAWLAAATCCMAAGLSLGGSLCMPA
jgi:hypothetical protein